MKLLIVTQRIDERDANLAFHVQWIAEMARFAGHITVIAQTVGAHAMLPPHVRVYSLEKELGASKWRQGWLLWRYLWRLVPVHDGVLVLMIPLYLLAAQMVAVWFRKKLFLWYAHGRVPLTLRLAVWCCVRVFTSSKNGFRIDTPKRLVLGQAIDTDAFSPARNVARVPGRIVTVGRISPVKHIDTMIETIALLYGKGLNVELHVIGDPILESDKAYLVLLRGLARSLGVEERVVFRGSLLPQALPQEYRQASVCLNASTTGSMDKAVLEALACECPVVTGNEAYQDLLPEEWFVKERAAEDYAAALERVLTSTETSVATLRALIVQNHARVRTIARMMECIQHELVTPASL